MIRRPLARLLALFAGLALVASTGEAAASTQHQARHDGFVVRHGDDLTLNGKDFRFAGTNNYYLMYKSHLMVDDVLNAAAANSFSVVRTWGWLDIGNQDGSNSVGGGKADGVYFHYWDGSAPAFNDGPDGLQHLDYVIYKAGQLGLKLVIPLTNNWTDFGGMDQYVRWRQRPAPRPVLHRPGDPRLVSGLDRAPAQPHQQLHRRQLQGRPDDHDVGAGNEPRCGGSGVLPASALLHDPDVHRVGRRHQPRYIDSVDRHHLVSSATRASWPSGPAPTGP